GMHGGTVGHAETGRGDIVHVIGHRQYAAGVGLHLLGEAAIAGQAHDPVTGLEMLDPGADAGDHAGRLAAGEKGNSGLTWYLPSMISVSGKLTPAAWTSMTTSLSPATGSVVSSSDRLLAGP